MESEEVGLGSERSCDAVIKKKSADDTGSSEAGVALWSCPEFGAVRQTLHHCRGKSLGVGLRRGHDLCQGWVSLGKISFRRGLSCKLFITKILS